MKLSDQVADKIKSDIKSKKYQAGEKLPAEPELMKLYGVGRSSIREAVKTLAISGFLKVQQGAGTFVNEATPVENMSNRLQRADFDEINAVRVLLEEEIVRLAVQHRNDEDLGEMRQRLEERKTAILQENRLACTNADIAFHMAIAQASRNSVLVDLYQYFTGNIRSFFSKRETQGITQFAMSHHLHEDLFNAIAQQQEHAALQTIKTILANNY
ncbi:FadR/GntR family transcriptional regulator [Mucilaginibacter agri]|nr:FCD domain-containing protein [Mucilaginibacter agri]